MSSSPALPSLSKFFVRASDCSRSGSRISPIPREAATGFARAPSQPCQLREVTPSDDATHSFEPNLQRFGERHGEEELATSKRSSRKTIAVGDKATASSKALKAAVAASLKFNKAPVEGQLRVNKPIADNVAEAVSEAAGVRIKEKALTKTARGSAQTTNRVKKASGSNPSTKRPKKPETGSVVEESLQDDLSRAPVTQAVDITMGLDAAVRRRRDWTPVEDTVEDLVAPHSMGETPEGVSATIGESHFDLLKNLVGDYGYAHEISAVTTKPGIARRSSGEALTKRRKLEVGWHDSNRVMLIEHQLVPISSGPAPEAARLKSKSPKKKPQTVTGKAIAPFIPIDEVPTNGILQYLTPETTLETTKGTISGETVQVSKGKVRKKTTKKSNAACEKPSKAAAPVLLPPEAALKRAEQQDLLFGTSSQLARDESPTYVRELQQAMAESELLESTTQLAHDAVVASSAISGSAVSSNLSLHTASRDLWSAAARNLNGALQDAEFVDLSITPKLRGSRGSEASAFHPAKADSSTTSLLTVDKQPILDPGWIAIDDTPKVLRAVDRDSISTSGQAHQDVQIPIPRSLAEGSLRNRPRSRSPIKKSGEHVPKEQVLQEKPQGMPNYRGFTAAELTKGIAAYGFKPVKRRDKQIALLEKCWESKNRVALQSLPTNVNSVHTAAVVEVECEPVKQKTPARKRGRPSKAKASAQREKSDKVAGKDESLTKTKGRPKKATAAASPRKKAVKRPLPATTPAAGDILDHGATPKPSVTSHPPPSPSLLVQVDPVSSADTTLTPLDRTALLHKITEAITTYPPTHDMDNLTWHEKILLYDPIVLEDLALWLNTEGLGKVGVDEEVSSGMVKEWCEARSVCCLWRENLRGGVRARY